MSTDPVLRDLRAAIEATLSPKSPMAKGLFGFGRRARHRAAASAHAAAAYPDHSHEHFATDHARSPEAHASYHLAMHDMHARLPGAGHRAAAEAHLDAHHAHTDLMPHGGENFGGTMTHDHAHHLSRVAMAATANTHRNL